MTNRLVIAFVGLLVLAVTFMQDAGDTVDKREACVLVRGSLSRVWTGAANTQEDSVAALEADDPEREAIEDYAGILRAEVRDLRGGDGGDIETACDDAFPYPWPASLLE